ncbi:MAG TPA: aminotransferase class I/II-fold pyridoxal phosphate-dependent enzyme [Rhodothermales bacterium]|nr:aminotransferase class I/II-fold pyridoxal phosphate-dependent enzyme [Rhodothermales bacterium]
MSPSTESDVLARALRAFRPEILREQPYVVGGLASPEVKLNQNESPFDLPREVKEMLFEAFLETPFNRYATEQPFRLRAALAERHGVSPESIVVGNGSNELTYTLGLCFIAPGSTVVLPAPMFALFEKVVHLYGGCLLKVPPRADLSFDVDALEAAIRAEKPSYTVVATPNNPTGLALTPADVERLAAASEGMLVVDEAYAEFVPETPSAIGLIERYPNMLVMRTFSKAFGLAGLRVGYLVGHPDVMRELMKSRLPFMVDPIAEHVALWLCGHDERVREIAADLRLRTQRLRRDATERPGVESLPTEANFFLLRLGGFDGPGLQAAFAAQGVSVRTMHAYPELPGCVRVSCGTEAENRRFLAALDVLAARAPHPAPVDDSAPPRTAPTEDGFYSG